MGNLRSDLRSRKHIVRSHRICLVVWDRLLLRIARIYRSEKTEHVKMQHGPQRERLAFDHPVVIFGKETPVRLYVLEEHVAVQDQ